MIIVPVILVMVIRNMMIKVMIMIYKKKNNINNNANNSYIIANNTNIIQLLAFEVCEAKHTGIDIVIILVKNKIRNIFSKYFLDRFMNNLHKPESLHGAPTVQHSKPQAFSRSSLPGYDTRHQAVNGIQRTNLPPKPIPPNLTGEYLRITTLDVANLAH